MDILASMIDIIRLATGIIILSYASITDIKTRTASNYLWVIIAVIGAVLLAVEYLLPQIQLQNLLYLVFIPVMIIMVYVFYQLRLIFGGADAKALMALTILAPLTPEIDIFPLYPTLMPFPWVILANSVIMFLFIPLGFLIFNISKKQMKFPNILLGYKMDIKKAREKFVWPLEIFENDKRKFQYMPKEIDIVKQLDKFEEKNISKIWVTPKIPFMIPLLVGYIVSFIIGDILFTAINYLF
ncbi:MAG: A24 family peptidase C-terminal domain-containing protein [Candidatus Thermoplasmatota archaeon]